MILASIVFSAIEPYVATVSAPHLTCHCKNQRDIGQKVNCFANICQLCIWRSCCSDQLAYHYTIGALQLGSCSGHKCRKFSRWPQTGSVRTFVMNYGSNFMQLLT